MSRRHTPRDGHTSTDLRAVNRTTNSTRAEASACPQVVAYHRELRAAGVRISLSSCRRLYVLYCNRYSDDEGFLAYCLTYADPTGETAVWHVLNERSLA